MRLNYNSVTELKTFLDENNLGMKKKYGQNFLINPDIRQNLVSALGTREGETVWEIGPGLGAMTSLLLDKGLSVRAFEIDKGFIRALKELFCENANFSLVEGDVLKTWPLHSPPDYLFGNLPYNIAAVLLAGFMEQNCLFRRIVVTVQREVALRMSASPGCPDYSSFSVLCSSFYRVKPLMLIKRTSFYPSPNVDSQAVLLELKDDHTIPPPCFYPLVRQLFSSRRKMIKNNLIGFIASGNYKNLSDTAALLLEKSAINGNKRAEDLAPEDFFTLAKTIECVGKL